MKQSIDYFGVKDFNKTYQKHLARIVKIQDDYNLEYDDVLDSYAWQTIDTEAHQRVMLQKRMGIEIKPREVATIINMYTRNAISRSLEYHDVPKSYDTAFYMAHYMKTNEGMADVHSLIMERLADEEE